MKLQEAVTVVRDVGCLLVGLAGIVHQEATGSVRPELLLVYTTLLGVPGALGLLSLRGRSSTSESPSQSPQSRSSSVP